MQKSMINLLSIADVISITNAIFGILAILFLFVYKIFEFKEINYDNKKKFLSVLTGIFIILLFVIRLSITHFVVQNTDRSFNIFTNLLILFVYIAFIPVITIFSLYIGRKNQIIEKINSTVMSYPRVRLKS